MIPVMIVEDEFLVRLGLKSLIDWNAYGFQIVADASDGQSALRLYQQYKSHGYPHGTHGRTGAHGRNPQAGSRCEIYYHLRL